MNTTDIEQILAERGASLDIYDTAPHWGVRLWARDDPTISVFGEGAILAEAIASAVMQWDHLVDGEDDSNDDDAPPMIYGNTKDAN